MNHLRMEHLLHTLREAQAAEGQEDQPNFNMRVWITRQPDTPGQLGTSRCGTSACAAGLAALDPWHQSEGLDPHINDHHTSSVGVPHFGNQSGFNALHHYFDLTLHQTVWLFDATWYGELDRDDNDEVHISSVIDRTEFLLAHPDFEPPEEPAESEED